MTVARRRLKAKEYKEINKARKDAGLSPLMTGMRDCLRCSERYFSDDMKNQHLCDDCRCDRVIEAESDRYYKE